MEVDERAHKATLMSTLHSLFPTTAAVKRLMGWRRSDDEEKWAEKAVETLVKKLKKKRGALDELQRAVSSPGAPSRCVTIPRSIDGRLQILHRKGMPHVIYCKLWRWADLRSHHELRALACCEFPFHAKAEEVCINPYHYRRVEPPLLPDLQLPHPLEQPAVPPESYSKCSMPSNVTLQTELAGQAACDEVLGLPQPEPQPRPLQRPSYGASGKPESVPYREMCAWATIAYYELNSRVGEPFQCAQSLVAVDGYTNPLYDGERFCLGKLPNVNRNSVIENVRQHIGPGVLLHYAGGELFAECTSARPIFVQSRICGYINNSNPTDVVKVLPGMTFKIFDNTLFSRILERAVHWGFAATYDLIKMCTIRMSFVKGWGADYHREDVTATPCWIEITLNGPLKWLDNVLVHMGNPTNAISSVS